MALTPDGSTLYVAAFGSSKVGVFETDELESDTFVPPQTRSTTSRSAAAARPACVLDGRAQGNRLYVLTRFDNAVRVVNTTTNSRADGA